MIRAPSLMSFFGNIYLNCVFLFIFNQNMSPYEVSYDRRCNFYSYPSLLKGGLVSSSMALISTFLQLFQSGRFTFLLWQASVVSLRSTRDLYSKDRILSTASPSYLMRWKFDHHYFFSVFNRFNQASQPFFLFFFWLQRLIGLVYSKLDFSSSWARLNYSLENSLILEKAGL